MLQLDGCPLSLYGMYLESGDIKRRGKQDGGLCVIELWVGAYFAKGHVRPECGKIQRRSLYEILKQILKLGGSKKFCLAIMCDDAESWGNDTADWSTAIFPLLQELRACENFSCAVLFTRKSYEQLQERGSTMRFRNEQEKRSYEALYETVDVLVTGQANCYCTSDQREVRFRDENLYGQVRHLLENQC